MTRDESIALFEACEAKRAEARAAALAEGKDEHEARRIAHEAARAHWNAWAEPLLAECKAMEADGRWAAEKDTIGRLVPKNELTRAWMEKAAVLFFRCVFLLRGDGTKDAAGEEEKPDTGAEPPVKLIQLEGDSTDFSGFVFPGSASFKSTHFRSEATFDSTKFERRAEFTGITFKRDVRFFDAAFQGGVWFHSATFEETAYFYRTIFQSEVVFTNAKFQSMAHFQITHFVGNAVFAHTAFRGPAWFFSSTFQGDASFENATFEEEACFNFTQFNAPASFALCDFLRHATFEASRFDAGASFGAIRGERGFNMADAVFKVVPDFIQAHFEEAPRLDNLEVGFTLPELKKIEDEDHAKLGRRGRWHRERLEKNWHYRRLFEAISKDSDLRNIPARFRALKRLAIQSHDTERELEFHAREMRAQRFIEHWPLPWLGKSSVVWKSVLGFWSGLLYGLFSNYGRSLLQPALFWLAGIVLGAVCYVSQSPAVIEARAAARAGGSYATVATLRTAAEAWLVKTVPCYAGGAVPPKDADGNLPPYIGALSAGLQSSTDAANEAWHLAFRNAFIVLDGSSEAAHRTYGCLYGVELYGGSNPLAVVPSPVSTISAIQKLFSALMIFLFGLALRNMLKMK